MGWFGAPSERHSLVLPACNCEAMQLHLDEITTNRLRGTPLSSLIRLVGMAPAYQDTIAEAS
jgi:hypothetical protein